MSLASLSVKLSQATSTSSPFTGWLDYATERVPLMQLESMKKTRGLLLGQAAPKPLAFVDGEEKIADPENRSLQRPRVFYRRELAVRPLVVTKLDGTSTSRN